MKNPEEVIMEGLLNEKVKKVKIPYAIVRVAVVVIAALLFFPSMSPANIIKQAGQAKLRLNDSLFAKALSYDKVKENLGRVLRLGYLEEWQMFVQFIGCILILLGIILALVGVCMSLGNIRMKNVGNRFLVGGSVAGLAGSVVVTVAYLLVSSTCNSEIVITQFPVGIPLFVAVFSVLLLLNIWIVFKIPKAEKTVKMEMETKYKLFLMLMPFLLLTFAFSYLPLVSWRYAFYDYHAGGELDTFVGLKWFKILLSKERLNDLFRVLKNTLGLSALGILTSWVPMAFAIFLTEIRSKKFKRFVQVFTTIPNFISWVLVYAIAFAIFSTDGFINTIIENFGGSASANYLDSTDHMWIKMLLWGMWKGVGWSAIIYISGIAGIDQQLYEAATVDGAGRFQKMRYITLPGLMPTYVVMLVMSIAGILSNGMDQYLVFSTSANQNYIEVLDLYVYNLGIDQGMIPISTVVGMTKSIISVALLFVANTVSKKVRGNSVV